MKVRKIISVLLSVIMVFSTFGFTVFAGEDTNVAKIGDELYADLNAALIAADEISMQSKANVTVEILKDIKISESWTPVVIHGYQGAQRITVNGNGKTISGLDNMLFESMFAGKAELVINNLTIADSKIVDTAGKYSSTGYGAFIGMIDSVSVVELNNCHLVRSTIEGGKWTGGFIGYTAGYNNLNDGPVFTHISVKNSSVKNCVIEGAIGSVGGVFGHASGNAWTSVTLSDSVIEGNKITANDENQRVGSIMGTIGAGGVANATYPDGEKAGHWISATVKNNDVTMNIYSDEECTQKTDEIKVETIYGRVGSSGTLQVIGGTYDKEPINRQDKTVSYPEYFYYDEATGKVKMAVAAEIDGEEYPTLEAAVAAVEVGKEETTVINIADGTHKFPKIGSAQVPISKNITIKGSKDAVIDVSVAVTAADAVLTFDGITVSFPSAANYTGFQHTREVTFIDCMIKGQQTNYAPVVKFVRCTLENRANAYCLWTYGAKEATFTDCTFNTSGKAVLVYNEKTADSFVADIVLNNCVFNDDEAVDTVKGAVETGTNGGNTDTGNKYNIRFKDCVVNGFALNNEGIPTGTKLYGNKNSMDAKHLKVWINDVYITECFVNGHSWDDGKVTEEATETATGIKTYTCTVKDCGETKTEIIPVKGHEHRYGNETTIPATCTTAGYTVKYCTCGDAVKTPIEATGHNYRNVVTAPSCTAQGYTTYTCGSCGHSYTDSFVPMTAHSWSEDEGKKTEATADTDGVKIYTCSSCEATKSEVIPKLGHTFEKGETTEPTCTEQGYTVYSCKTCDNHRDIRDFVPAKGHTLKNTVVEPTCTSKGYTVHSCTVDGCGYTYTDSFVQIKEHSWVGKVTTAPTGNTKGEKTYTCSVCGAVKTEIIPATGCAFTAEVTAPTCTEQGYTTYTCTACTDEAKGHSYKGDYVPAAGHTLKTEVVTPTCTSKGYTAHTCVKDDCNYTVKSAVTEMLAHSYLYFGTTPATTDAEGEITYRCDCGAEKKEIIPATEHDFTSEETKAAACVEEGIITYTCTGCAEEGKDHTYTEVLPALGHSWGEKQVTNPTCKNSGYTTQICTADGCGAKRITEKTDMVNHTFNANGKCIVCGAENASAIEDKTVLKGYAGALSEETIPETLSYSTAEEITEVMAEAGELNDNMTSELYDITLKVNDEICTANNFPAEGHVFSIPVPSKAKKGTIAVSHMITETYGGGIAGDIESLDSWLDEEGDNVCFRTYSTSPVLLSYEEKSNRHGSVATTTSSASEYTVKFETDGGSAVEAVFVKAGTALVEPEAPVKEGFTFDGWYTDRELTKEYDFSSKVTKAFTLYAGWAEEKTDDEPALGENPFKDIDADDWFYNAVMFAYENNITSGVSETEFAPDSKVTRGQFITMLCRAYDIPERDGDNFDDAGNTWYTPYLAAAKQLGISNGTGNNKFAPEKEITREEMVTLIYNYLKSTEEASEGASETSFADRDMISDWAKSAVAFASSNGYVNGKDNNMFDPQGTATRAELAQILYNIFAE